MDMSAEQQTKATIKHLRFIEIMHGEPESLNLRDVCNFLYDVLDSYIQIKFQ